jgi:tartrate dehydratase alpha subunit/fumarate hydratase class I-like protein
MTAFASKARKIVAGLLTASALAAVLAPTAASAHDHHRFGYGAAGFGGGLLVGALIASQPRYVESEVVYAPRCWTERRRVYDAFGNWYRQRVRICD